MTRWLTSIRCFVALPALAAALAGAQVEQAPAAPRVNSLALPTEITSDSMDFDLEKRTAIFLGNVIVRDGEFKLLAETMTVQFSAKDELERIEAEGSIHAFSGGNEATGGRAVYNVLTETFELFEEPVLKQGLHEIIGANKIVYDRKNGRFSTVDGRVRMRYNAGEKPVPVIERESGTEKD